MKEQLYEIMAEMLKIDIKDVTEDLSAKDVEEWDSLMHLLILEAVESKFRINIPIEDAAEADTVGKLLKLVGECK